MTEQALTHLNASGQARMVDVSAKPPTRRRATADARVHMSTEAASAIAESSAAKGDVLAVARVAGIQSAKRTSELIPLCHQVSLSSVSVDFSVASHHVDVKVKVETTDRTGVEMEALVACATAALTIYDMCKSIDRAMVIDGLCLKSKSGGRSGTFTR